MNKEKLIAYPYSYCFNGKYKTLLWVTSEEDNSDKFLFSDESQLYIAGGLSDAKNKFKNVDFEISWDEYSEVDFDEFWSELSGLESPTKAVDYDVILDGWNYIEDVLRTYSLIELRSKLDNLIDNNAYKKIFRGSNIGELLSESNGRQLQWGSDEVLSMVSDIKYVWDGISEEVEALWQRIRAE